MQYGPSGQPYATSLKALQFPDSDVIRTTPGGSDRDHLAAVAASRGASAVPTLAPQPSMIGARRPAPSPQPQPQPGVSQLPPGSNLGGFGTSANLASIAPKAPAWQINDRPDGQQEAVKDPQTGAWVTSPNPNAVITNTTPNPAPVALAGQLTQQGVPVSQMPVTPQTPPGQPTQQQPLAGQLPGAPGMPPMQPQAGQMPQMQSIAPVIPPGTQGPPGYAQPPTVQSAPTDRGQGSMSQHSGITETPDAAPGGASADLKPVPGKMGRGKVPAYLNPKTPGFKPAGPYSSALGPDFIPTLGGTGTSPSTAPARLQAAETIGGAEYPWQKAYKQHQWNLALANKEIDGRGVILKGPQRGQLIGPALDVREQHVSPEDRAGYAAMANNRQAPEGWNPPVAPLGSFGKGSVLTTPLTPSSGSQTHSWDDPKISPTAKFEAGKQAVSERANMPDAGPGFPVVHGGGVTAVGGGKYGAGGYSYDKTDDGMGPPRPTPNIFAPGMTPSTAMEQHTGLAPDGTGRFLPSEVAAIQGNIQRAKNYVTEHADSAKSMPSIAPPTNAPAPYPGDAPGVANQLAVSSANVAGNGGLASTGQMQHPKPVEPAPSAEPKITPTEAMQPTSVASILHPSTPPEYHTQEAFEKRNKDSPYGGILEPWVDAAKSIAPKAPAYPRPPVASEDPDMRPATPETPMPEPPPRSANPMQDFVNSQIGGNSNDSRTVQSDQSKIPQAAQGRVLPGMTYYPMEHSGSDGGDIGKAAHGRMLPGFPMAQPRGADGGDVGETSETSEDDNDEDDHMKRAKSIAPLLIAVHGLMHPKPKRKMTKGGTMPGRPSIAPPNMNNVTSTNESGQTSGMGELAVRHSDGAAQMLTKPNQVYANIGSSPVSIYPTDHRGMVMPIHGASAMPPGNPSVKGRGVSSMV